MRMDPRPLLRSILPALLAAILLAGCGGDGQKEEYLDGLAVVKRHLDAASKASLESGSAQGDERSERLEVAHEELVEAADVAAELDPPEDAAGAHEDFAEALDEYAKLYRELALLEPGDEDEAELYGKAGQIAERLSSASRRLEKAGYKLPPSKREQEEADS